MSATSPGSPVSPGQLLAGKYRVEHVLGEGGMGVVVAATHTQLEKRVALKFMLPSALRDQVAVERFLREARSAVQLTSEHVARVLDVGTLESGAPYIVMELLEGRTLEDLLHEKKQLPVREAIEYVVQVCEAVAEAHARNIIHRDLKPANLFLTQRLDRKPLVKVLDFGLSKIIGPNARTITRDLAVMGTPEYMSPEQLRSSKDVDTRTDLWSLGIILYELVAGRSPFFAESVAEVCSLVLNAPPRPLCELAPDVPEALVAIVERSLEKDPTRRYQDVASFAEALDPFAPQGSLPPAQRIRRVQFESVAPVKWSRLNSTEAPTLVAEAEFNPKTGGVTWGGQARTRRRVRTGGALLALVVAVAAVSYLVVGRHATRADVVTAVAPAALPSSEPVPSASAPRVVVAPPEAATALPPPQPAATIPPPEPSRAPAAMGVKRPSTRPVRPKPSRDKLLESR